LQKKIENWFVRRLEKLEVRLLELHEPKVNGVLQKLRKFKKCMPWRSIAGGEGAHRRQGVHHSSHQ
jgi:hypothetical protein